MYFQIFRGVNQRWFWRLCSSENQKLAFSSQGYADKQEALYFINCLQESLGASTIEELDN